MARGDLVITSITKLEIGDDQSAVFQPLDGRIGNRATFPRGYDRFGLWVPRASSVVGAEQDCLGGGVRVSPVLPALLLLHHAQQLTVRQELDDAVMAIGVLVSVDDDISVLRKGLAHL